MTKVGQGKTSDCSWPRGQPVYGSFDPLGTLKPVHIQLDRDEATFGHEANQGERTEENCDGL